MISCDWLGVGLYNVIVKKTYVCVQEIDIFTLICIDQIDVNQVFDCLARIFVMYVIQNHLIDLL